MELVIYYSVLEQSFFCPSCYRHFSNRGWSGLDSWRGLGIFLFETMSRSALESTQPSIQRVPGALSLGVKRPEREADDTPQSSAEVKECVELHLRSPNSSSWRGA